MRKNVFGRKFKRDKNQRRALFKGLMSSLVIYGKIKTTEAKVKAIKGEVDKLVTKSRKEEGLARRLLEPHLTAAALDKFLLEVAPSFKGRNSGFTKTVRLGGRLKDNASLVLLTWTDEVQVKTPAPRQGGQSLNLKAKEKRKTKTSVSRKLAAKKTSARTRKAAKK